MLQRCWRDPHPTVPLWAVCSGRAFSVTSDEPPRFCHVLEHHVDVRWVRAYTSTYGMMMNDVLSSGGQSCADAFLPKAR